MADPTLLNRVATGGPDAANSDRFPVAIEDRIFKIYADLNPLVRLSTENRKSVKQQDFKVLEDRERPRTAQTNGGTLTSGATTLTFNDSTRFRPKDQWMNTRTNEHIHVLTVPSATTITCIRGYGTQAAAALLDDDTWQWVGNALEQSASAVSALIPKTSTITNYTQYFDETTSLTEIANNVEYYGEPEMKRQRDHGMRNIKLAVESAFWFGQPLADIEGDSPKDSTSGIDTRYKTGGAKYWIDNNASANVMDASGAISLLDLWDWVGTLTEKAPANKGNGEVNLMLFGGRRAITALNMLAIDKIELSSNQNEFGFNLQKITTAFGTLMVKQQPLFNDNYSDHLFGINADFVGYRFLQNMDIKMRVLDMNDSTGGHEMKDEFYGVIGFWMGGAELHGYIKNVQTAV